MAVDSKRTLGITKEFNAVWRLFGENLGGQKQSDLIRRLIFQHTLLQILLQIMMEIWIEQKNFAN